MTAYESRGLAFDEEERVKPLEGTVTDDYIRDTRSQDGPLGDWLPDVDSDGQDALESLQHLTAFWTPRNGDIKILPHLYAQQITNLTGTSIYFEEAEQRCRLFHGQFSIALEKLQRLEPLLVRAYLLCRDKTDTQRKSSNTSRRSNHSGLRQISSSGIRLKERLELSMCTYNPVTPHTTES